jgi:hypothetical protein
VKVQIEARFLVDVIISEAADPRRLRFWGHLGFYEPARKLESDRDRVLQEKMGARRLPEVHTRKINVVLGGMINGGHTTYPKTAVTLVKTNTAALFSKLLER